MSAYKSKKRAKKDQSSSNLDSDEWVEKKSTCNTKDGSSHDEWMSMTGKLKTYTKDDLKPKSEKADKQQIDSYNPAQSSRELNPYWKNGGSGVPQTSEELRKTRTFKKPLQEDDYYSSKSAGSSRDRDHDRGGHQSSSKYNHYDNNYSSKSSYSKHDRTGNWRKSSKTEKSSSEATSTDIHTKRRDDEDRKAVNEIDEKKEKKEQAIKSESEDKYLSDEKMNKLGAKLVKAEIMGNEKLVSELKVKLEAAREYRKQNPNAGKKDEDGIMLTTTNTMGNARPLTKSSQGDPRSKGGKRKADTHLAGERQKYFEDDDKQNLSQMFEQEKYGTNNDDAEFANIISKHKNPNDDLEDIFAEEISKNKNVAKEDDREKQKAIKQHARIEKSLDGCEYCLDSKNMMKHLMVSRGEKVYVALPSRKSLVNGHCQISTLHHATCVTSLDEDVWEEIMDYRKALTKYYNSLREDVVFFELATGLHKFPHVVINCVPLPRDAGDTAAIYFKKALLECESEWAMNKKVIDLKGKNIRKGVPKGLPYFWVDFGMDPGFAHVIEDQRLFPKMFAEEIIGGMLDLDHGLWKNPKRDYTDQQRKKVLEFVAKWKPFDTVSKTYN